ncbi:MAG TPA: hypothetical protein PK683_10975, partial [Leptospiraceae bacterium]|nr:hypothetical protein [Leptospiraceae bacterium]
NFFLILSANQNIFRKGQYYMQAYCMTMKESWKIFTVLLLFLHIMCFGGGVKKTAFEERKEKAFETLQSGKEQLLGKNWEKSIDKFDRACREFALIDEKEGLLKCRTEKARYFIRKENYREAESWLAKAREDSISLSKIYLRSVMNLFIFLEMKRKNFEGTEKYIAEAEKLSGEKEEMMDTWYISGMTFFEKKDWSRAAEYLEKSSGSERERTVSSSYAFLSEIRLREKKYESAMNYSEKAASIDRKNAWPSFLAYDYVLSSESCAGLGKKEEAVFFRKKALEIHDALERKESSEKDRKFISEIMK